MKRLGLCLCAGVLSCSSPVPAGPELTAVLPPAAAQGQDSDITIVGRNFFPRVTASFSDTGLAAVASQFRASLDGVALQNVRYIDSRHLQATVPATLTAGIHNVIVVDPRLRTSVLPNAFECVAAPPLASASVQPPVVIVGAAFVADGSASASAVQTLPELAFAWDWSNDGVFDAGGAMAGSSFATPGSYEIVLQVTDATGRSAYASFTEQVVAAMDLLTVTTAADERDVGATPVASGGTGFSLAEALACADATPGRQTIFVPAGMVIALTAALPDHTDPDGVDIVGDGAMVDGSQAGTSGCWILTGDAVHLLGLTFSNCQGTALQQTAGTGGTIERCTFLNNATGVQLGSAGNTFGPDNLVLANQGDGVQVTAPNVIFSSRFLKNSGNGITLGAGSAASLVRDNFIYANGQSGIALTAGADGCVVVNNTLDANNTSAQAGAGGVAVDSSVGQVNFRNDLVTNNFGFGVVGVDASFVHLDYDDLFANSLGGCSACTATGRHMRAADPQYVNAVSGDYRVLALSPAIDAGVDLGYDVNGPAASNFNGAAPDLGAWESP